MFDVGDSGIDTDGEEERPQSDGSSSEDEAEPMIAQWWDQQKTNDEPLNEAGRSDAAKEPKPGQNRSWWSRLDLKINEKDMKDGQHNPIGDWPNDSAKATGVPDSPDRSSPPLFEVELTASDEDDDASVLELVIPMSSSRYQRVPTSSPKKAKPKPRFCFIFCCLRK